MSEWIAVSVELPDDGVHVLTVDTSGIIGLSWREEGAWWTSDETGKPVHWRHLPDRPQDIMKGNRDA